MGNLCSDKNKITCEANQTQVQTITIVFFFSMCHIEGCFLFSLSHSQVCFNLVFSYKSLLYSSKTKAKKKKKCKNPKQKTVRKGQESQESCSCAHVDMVLLSWSTDQGAQGWHREEANRIFTKSFQNNRVINKYFIRANRKV